jgi:hypothetical protein
MPSIVQGVLQSSTDIAAVKPRGGGYASDST